MRTLTAGKASVVDVSYGDNVRFFARPRRNASHCGNDRERLRRDDSIEQKLRLSASSKRTMPQRLLRVSPVELLAAPQMLEFVNHAPERKYSFTDPLSNRVRQPDGTWKDIRSNKLM